MWQLVVFPLAVVTLLVLKIWRLEKHWRDLGIPYEPYYSYLYTVFVRFQRENVFDVLRDYSKKYGGVYGTYHGLTPLMRVSSLEAVKDLLIRSFPRAFQRTIDVSTGVPLWDNALIAQPYHNWKTLRQLGGVALTNNKLRGMTPQMELLGKRLASRMAEAARTSDNKLEPHDSALRFALDGLCAMVFGVELDAGADPDNTFVVNCSNIFPPGLGLFLFTSVPSLIKYVPFLDFPPKKTVEFFKSFISFAIKQRRQRSTPGASTDDRSALDVWLREQEISPSFTDDAIASQMFFFVLAGYDTVANTLYFTLYFLATNPEAQERAYDEIVTATPQSDGDTSFVDFTKLKFLEACVLETLRLCPTDFAVDRICDEPCTIAGYDISAGTIVQIPVPVIQSDPSYFPEPDKFRPERFLDGSSNVEAFMAFGDGPKHCMGKRLALFEVIVAVSCILRQLKLDRCAETPEKVVFLEGGHFMPIPKYPLVIGLSERQ